VFASLWDAENILKPERIGDISANNSVNKEVAVVHNHRCFTIREGVTEAVAQDDNSWDTFSTFMWTGGWFGGPGTTELVKHPMAGCC